MKSIVGIFVLIATFNIFASDQVENLESRNTVSCVFVCNSFEAFSLTSLAVAIGGYIGWKKGLIECEYYIFSQQLLDSYIIRGLAGYHDTIIFFVIYLDALGLLPAVDVDQILEPGGIQNHMGLAFLIFKHTIRTSAALFSLTIVLAIIISSYYISKIVMQHLTEERCQCNAY